MALYEEPRATPRHAGAMAGRAAPVRLSLALRTNREAGVRRVLLLNVTYEPLTTVGLRRAVCLVLGEKAEVVHDDAEGDLLRSASVVLVTPSVIRLRRYVRVPYRSRVPLTRGALMRRDNYQCAYCGHRAETIDHVVPRSRGGTHTWARTWGGPGAAPPPFRVARTGG